MDKKKLIITTAVLVSAIGVHFNNAEETHNVSLFTNLVYSNTVAYPKDLWKGIIGEAVGEGYDGMYAVACVYKNRLRKGMPLGCVALKRKDLDDFVQKQGGDNVKIAKSIIKRIFVSNEGDAVNGATHYENIELFGLPPWHKSVTKVCKIGNHTFYK